MRDADEIIRALGLVPHPEGGFYRETFRDQDGAGGRAHGTAIFYLLRAGEESRWHRVDAAEIWHFYAGDPLELIVVQPGKRQRFVLGTALGAGELPQLVVPAQAWQAARPLGRFTLAGCTVAPGFEFRGFEMAPEGWQPD